MPIRRLLAVARPALLGLLTAAGGPLTELPYPIKPPDPIAVLNALRPHLPPNWHMGQPYSYLGVSYVRVLIQDEWRGNPISAAIALCPGTEDSIWLSARIIRLVMRHHQRDWPPYDCRP